MSVRLPDLISYLDQHLSSQLIKDYCPNGLQVEGKKEINTIVTGVTASEALIDAAIEHQADAILVHHGYFWKGESQVITGMKKARIGKLLANDISLITYHLPIDVHPEHGNNAQLAKLLGIKNVTAVESISPKGVLMQGELESPMTAEMFGKKITTALQRAPMISSVRNQLIETIGWCTGGGQGYIDKAAELGLDAFLTGEASEQTIHSSREQNIDFFAAGHHATERYGVKAVGEYIAEQLDLNVVFVDIHNPV